MSDEPLTAEQPLGHLTPDELLGGDFDTVILATVDIQGRLVGKRLSPRAFVNKVLTGIHVCTCTLAWDMDQSLEGIAVEYAGLHTGWHDFVIQPDVSTLRVAAWSDRTAICLGDAVDHDGELVPIAPRTILRRQLERLAAAGLTATTATELEFFLYRGSYESARERDYRDLVPTTTRHADYAIQETEDLEYFFGPLRRALEQSGLPADMCQGEWGLGQWEMNLDHGAPLAIADAHALFKLGVKTMGSRAGLSASFMARPETDTGIGSSCHVHVSLRDDDGRALFHDAVTDRGADALVRADGQQLPANGQRRLRRPRGDVGLRQPHRDLPRGRGIGHRHAAGVPRARRRRQPLPRARRAAGLGRRRIGALGRPRAADHRQRL